MRISAKVDYAVRAMAELAAAGGDVLKAEHIARAQDIPLKFLLTILSELKRAHLLRSQRGAEGGFWLSRPASDISIADVFRAVEGPLADVHDSSLSGLSYTGAAESLKDVWMAVRSSLRSVLESVSLADLASGKLPAKVRALAERYEAATRR